MNTQPESPLYNFQTWQPPFVLAEVKALMEQDLRRALASFLGRETKDLKERDAIIQTIGRVTLGWEQRLEMSVDMTATHTEEVCELKFGETELGVEFDYPVEMSA